MDIENFSLPDGCSVENHSGDLIIVGPWLDAEQFREIVQDLPAEVASRVIGWKKITKR